MSYTAAHAEGSIQSKFAWNSQRQQQFEVLPNSRLDTSLSCTSVQNVGKTDGEKKEKRTASILFLPLADNGFLQRQSRLSRAGLLFEWTRWKQCNETLVNPPVVLIILGWICFQHRGTELFVVVYRLLKVGPHLSRSQDCRQTTTCLQSQACRLSHDAESKMLLQWCWCALAELILHITGLEEY